MNPMAENLNQTTRSSWPNPSCRKKEGNYFFVLSNKNKEEYKTNAKCSSETYMAFYQNLENLNLAQVINYLEQGVNPFITNDRDPFKILEDSSHKYPIDLFHNPTRVNIC